MGRWVAVAESPRGKVRCVRTFSRVLGGVYVKLAALWKYGGSTCEEMAFYGPWDDGTLAFWFFTSNGKRFTEHHYIKG